jgi:hypothetical protein
MCSYFNKSWSQSLYRIEKAFRNYSPEYVQWVDYPEAEAAIVPIVGAGEVPICEKILADGKKLIINQVCYLTSGYEKWPELWEKAVFTFSFHNLSDYTNVQFNFKSFPLGADKNLFFNVHKNRVAKAFTTGYIAETEYIDKIFEACKKTNNFMVHTGADFNWDNIYYKHLPHQEDPGLNYVLGQVQYIPGLRAIEGFEMLCIEGAFGGAVPVVLDLPTYRWYKDFGIFIDPNQNITEQLVSIFKKEYFPLSEETISKVKLEFSWDVLIPTIFEEIRKYI